MHRIPLLQRFFDAARIKKQAGSDIKVTPVYISIYPNGSVKDTGRNILSISGDPTYIYLLGVINQKLSVYII